MQSDYPAAHVFPGDRSKPGFLELGREHFLYGKLAD
jgi:hypothetical protein